jgi:hypothetical protein
MFYTIPTKRGLGVELWGTYDDLNILYDVISKFWNNDRLKPVPGSENRDKLISGFSYELRHAFQGSRLTRESAHFSGEAIPYFGCEISWPHMFFSLAVLRYNMHFIAPEKFELGIFLMLEHWLQRSMEEFDQEGAVLLMPFLEGAIHAANPCLYQFMRSINMEYFLLGGGKESFRKLPKLLKRAQYPGSNYDSYMGFLTTEAARLKCEASVLEFDEENTLYEIEW